MLIFYGALKPKWDMSCEGVKSEIECVPHMQNKKWNSLVKMSCLSLTQFLRYLWRNLSSQSRSQDFARISTFRFSAPKNWKTSGSQPDVLLQEIFHKKSSLLAGHVYFSFWFWKWRGRVKMKNVCAKWLILYSFVFDNKWQLSGNIVKGNWLREKNLFVWSSLSFTFPLHAQKFISRKISSNTIQLDLSPNCPLQLVTNRKKLTRRKPTNVNERLMEHF